MTGFTGRGGKGSGSAPALRSWGALAQKPEPAQKPEQKPEQKPAQKPAPEPKP